MAQSIEQNFCAWKLDLKVGLCSHEVDLEKHRTSKNLSDLLGFLREAVAAEKVEKLTQLGVLLGLPIDDSEELWKSKTTTARNRTQERCKAREDAVSIASVHPELATNMLDEDLQVWTIIHVRLPNSMHNFNGKFTVYESYQNIKRQYVTKPLVYKFGLKRQFDLADFDVEHEIQRKQGSYELKSLAVRHFLCGHFMAVNQCADYLT